MMNAFEETIVEGAIRADKAYYKMSGHWLSHAPESFLQSLIAQAIAKQGYFVYMDRSISKILTDHDNLKSATAGEGLTKRPDISVWLKTKNQLKAVIEIKRSWRSHPIKRDVARNRIILKSHYGPRSAYVLGYCERKSENTLDQCFDNWAKATSTELVHKHIDNREHEKWRWGFCLLRADRRKADGAHRSD
jgi:hypothetical protein